MKTPQAQLTELGLLYFQYCNFAARAALSHAIMIRRRFYKNCQYEQGTYF